MIYLFSMNLNFCTLDKREIKECVDRQLKVYEYWERVFCNKNLINIKFLKIKHLNFKHANDI